MKTVRDLLDEAKKRTILVLIWVVGLAYAMSLTSHSFWVNIPVALLIIAVLRCLSGEIVVRWRSSRPFATAIPPSISRKRGRGRQAPTKFPSANHTLLEFWRRGVEAPEVEAALSDLTKSVVSEWVTNLWFSSISSDQEFPDELMALINGVLGEVAQRAKRVNLITLLTQDIVDLVASHLELFRRTQARVGADILGILSSEERDENLKSALAATGELHPALVSAESESKVLQKLMGGVVALVLKPSDGHCRVLRSLAREMLACAVMRPVMNIASPAFINMQIENAAISSQNAPLPKVEANASKPAKRAPDPPLYKEPSEPGLEMVEVTPSKGQHVQSESLTRGASTDLGGKNEAKSPGGTPLDKKDGYSGSQRENWAQVLEVVNQRKTQALAPEHLDNLWTKGRNYKKRELNKAAVKPKETNITKEQPVSHPLAVEPPVPQVKPKKPDGKTTELVELRPVSQQSAGVSLAGTEQVESNPSRAHGFEQEVVPMRKSRSSGGLLDGWQDLEQQHHQEGIPSMLKAGDATGYDPRRKCAVRRVGGKLTFMESAQPENLPLATQTSWTSQLQVDVVGAHFEKSAANKTFAVYSIFVTDGPDGHNRTWEVQRRFRNFEQLHRSLKDKPYYSLSLPSKRFLSSNLDNSLIRERCALLDQYLKDLLSIPSLAELHEVWDFLSANSQTYGFGESQSMFKTLTSNVDDAVDDMFRQFRNMSENNQEKLKTAPPDLRQRAGFYNTQIANNNPNISHLPILTLPVSNGVSSRPMGIAADKKAASQQMYWEDDSLYPAHYDLPQNVGNLAWRSEYDLQPSGQAAGSPLGSESGGLEAHRDARSNFDVNKLYDGKERALSEGHSPVGSLAGSDMAEDDNLAIPPDWGPPKVSVPLLNLVDGIFELQGRGWIRRQVFWMAKQILTLGMGDAIDDFLLGKIQWLRKEEVVASGIRWLHRILWPDGVFLTKHPSRQQANNHNGTNGQAESFEHRLEAARRAGVVREIILDRAPAGLVSLIGSKQYKRCATDIYFFLQSGVCIKQLAFSLLEMLLVSAFPELHDLVLEVHAM
ncbi:sorting nexin-13 [Marchantia polymorpha subsp. ruderalis]|uniref:PX domain-containing protein n=2 Tax=Marchantia polymorpha TaxID=3197 RepID=A0AAF6B1X1_MARPO|nr:hypothetical protein MARPO_0039s0032 [Marchantia polymorpha]BBN06005.1 hypothetical protein Mp_3g17640 [Marchantia polymorpha subsp. ruderalis]|eukprot:PTQ40523.1 hypothetical protein MARPO_0039s0032 [Marchantia polymorpha]